MHKHHYIFTEYKTSNITQNKMYQYFTISVILAILVPILLLLYRRWISRPPPNPHLKLPPGPRGFPIIGNLPMLGNLPHRSITELAKKYGPIMSLRLGYVPAIVVSSPQAAELFLKTHDTVFASRPKTQAAEFFCYGTKGIVFTPYGPYWRNMKKICARELLSAKMIDSFAWMRREELESFVKNIKKASGSQVAVNVSKMVGELIQDMICRMLFGRSRDARFDLSGILEEITDTVGAFNIVDYLPCTRGLDLQGLARRAKRTSKDFDEMLELIIDEHEVIGNLKQENKNTDFVDMLLSLKNSLASTDDPLSHTFNRTNVKAILVDMVFGAIDTSHTAVIWVMSELIRHSRVMTRVQKELEMVVGNDDIVEEACLSKLDYLYMVVKESLRLHPVAPLSVPHESTDDILVDGYYIPKKSRIIINNWGLGRDPNVWSENAQEFIPERFIGSKIDLQGQDFQLIPFGSGRRRCPGMHLGLINIQLLVAQMVHCFDWELSTGISPIESEMDEKFGLTMSRVNHLVATPTVRVREKIPA